MLDPNQMSDILSCYLYIFFIIIPTKRYKYRWARAKERQEEVAHKQSWLTNRPNPPSPESLTCAHGSRWRPCEVRLPLLFPNMVFYCEESKLCASTYMPLYLPFIDDGGGVVVAHIIVPLWEWTHVLVLERVWDWAPRRYDWACCWIPRVFVSELIYKEG